MLRLYSAPIFSEKHLKRVAQDLKTIDENFNNLTVKSEACYYVVLKTGKNEELFLQKYRKRLEWLLAKPIGQSYLDSKPGLEAENDNQALIEIGPRLTFTTAFSTNAVSACRSAGMASITRLERSLRYLVTVENGGKIDPSTISKMAAKLHDRMTECCYETPPETFDSGIEKENVREIDVLSEGGLEKANADMGLAFDAWDMEYYRRLFREKVKRNPTDVELFDLAQSNSEHCRHWFFKGKMLLDGQEEQKSLFQMVMDTQNTSNPNNVIKFCDNSSGIEGFQVEYLLPENAGTSSELIVEGGPRHIIYTAETHNFPTGVCPFPGAATGTGGRIRDVHATGRGAHEVVGVAGYSFGNLHIPGYELPWEENWDYPANFASPREISIQASNGASDYGNKFGEPVISGFARSFGQILPNSERCEYVKPIMFSGGLGAIDGDQTKKLEPQKDMLVVKFGGPAYRIGVGGGSASSVHVQGDSSRVDELDFGAVQRGDPEMAQKLHRAVRGCVEMGENNPILSIHDQGAGGNGNVIKELVEGCGAVVQSDSFDLGDPTLSVRELWGAEFQESSALLINDAQRPAVAAVCQRERCPVSVVGNLTGDNRMVVKDFSDSSSAESRLPVDIDLDWALGSIPRKEFHLCSKPHTTSPLSLPPNLTVASALERVLRLPCVASKRYLTNKVDRSVTGLVAQQQCVGPLHTPIADVAVMALTFFDKMGAAVALGEQPIKGLVNAKCGARMSVGEALTNLVFAPISDLKDVKCSGNWMWPAKLKGEGAELVHACKAMCALMAQLGIAIDGGKDSLSMAAKVGQQVVKSPGTLVISAYAPCPDITKVVTPDLKCPDDQGSLIYIRLGNNCVHPWAAEGAPKHRLGGSALAQCYKQLGSSVPDLDQPRVFESGFRLTQKFVKDGIIKAGHDISDGGLITCLLEMAFAGNCSIDVDIDLVVDPIQLLFAEELGIVIEVEEIETETIVNEYRKEGLFAMKIGKSIAEFGPDAKIQIAVSGDHAFSGPLFYWRSVWERTSFELEKLQADPDCARQEQEFLRTCKQLPWKISFPFGTESNDCSNGVERPLAAPPSIAIIREEGSNGDREMAVAFHMAGFQIWDVCMQDFLDKKVNLDMFRGCAFVGGFSYADVLGSAKGWCSSIMFHESIRQQFDHFLNRTDTFSLGVCNGCQLMALLGWVGEDKGSVMLEQNDCERFQSYFNTVRIEKSNSIMLKDMQESVLGVWVSHGEGKFVYSDDSVLYNLESRGLVALRYVDQENRPAQTYPMNPNGSTNGVAGLCSDDGRHLALMPHPERCFLNWQWPYWPKTLPKPSDNKSPWFKMFQNAFEWCLKTSE